MNKMLTYRHSSKENLKREIQIHKKLHHPHIITLYHYFEDHENVYIILEYATNGSLYDLIRRKKECSEKQGFVFFLQTALGIDYLHKKGIIHRDIKV